MGVAHTRYGREAAREVTAAVHLPVTAHIGPATLVTRDGALMQVIQLTGISYSTADMAELDRLRDQRNRRLLELQSPELSIWTHVVRRPEAHYSPATFENPFLARLDADYRAATEGVSQFVNALYLTVVLAPPRIKAGSWLGQLRAVMPGHPEERTPLKKQAQRLEALVRTLVGQLEPYGPRVLQVNNRHDRDGVAVSEPLGVWAEILNGAPSNVPMGFLPANEAIGNASIAFGRETVLRRRPGDHDYGAILSIKDYPSTTRTGMLDGLLRAPCGFVLTQAFSFVPKPVAMEAMQRQQRKLANAEDVAVSQHTQLDAGLDALAGNRQCMGRYHFSLLCSAPTEDALTRHLGYCQGVLGDAGLTSVREGLGLEPAFWAQFPGNHRYMTRPVLLTSRNFAALMVCHNDPAGHPRRPPWGEAVVLLKTRSQTPYYFNFHHGAPSVSQPNGNTTIIGPTGSGKTVLALFLLAFLHKLGVMRVIFDKDRGAEIAIRAMGGTYHVFRVGQPSGLNPCQLPDTPANRHFLGEWLILLGRGERALTPSELAQIGQAVDGNYRLPAPQRRLSNLAGFFPPESRDGLRARLDRWLTGQPNGWLFDNPTDDLSLTGLLMGLDVTDFIERPELRTPLMYYLRYRVNALLDGRPACLAFDEGWKLLDDPVFAGDLQDWMKTIRKKNGMTLFMTQEPADILGTGPGGTVVSQSVTQIFLPNPKAVRTDYVDGFKLTEREYTLIREMPEEDRCFLLRQGARSVLIDFALTDMRQVLTVLSGTTANVARLETLRAEVGDDPAAWLPRFWEENNANI